MSTPHKLNVTFWDMPEETPNNGYNLKFAEANLKKAVLNPICDFLRPLPVRFCFSAGLLLLAWAADVADFALPFLAVAAVHFWHSIFQRGKLTAELSHGLFCASVFGEIAGASVADGFWIRTVVHSGVLLLTGFLLGQEPTLMLYAGCRFFLWACLPCVPDSARALLCYASAVLGAVAAKYVEVFLMAQILPDLKLSTPRRRRASNNTIFNVYKMRRTSLPALGGSFKSSHHSFGFQGSASTVDVALLAEAHGLVTDMLADPHLPPHVVGGLRSLACLLSPPQVVNHRTHRPGGTSISLADFNSGSDNEEIPYTGEKPSALTKRLRRNLPPSILRRMSTSTWTTTTSATGLPTLEPEPSRKRSTSFRHPTDSQNTSPRGGSSPQTGCALSPSRSHHVTIPSCSKGRSYSTTSIPSSALTRRNSRDRKTVCSLHPLTLAEIEAFHEAHAQREDDLQLFQRRMVAAQREADAETTEDDDEIGQPLPPLPCIRRALKGEGIISSDYESSNESPVSSENNDLMADEHPPKSLSVQTTSGQDLSRCTMCGAKTRHGVSVEPSLRSPNGEDVTPTMQDEEEDNAPGLLVNGHRFELESLDSDPLLNRINEWDYPIFDLKEQAKDLILSQMCYKIFHEVGLFEAFKIPVHEFLNYFHAVESGYREKPYHNRMHAADVLQGVYYLTSQPIPGFTQIPSEATDSPLHKTSESSGSSSTLVHRPSFTAEASYGVMGANYPALELMALYAAAAMHDYDHPGRTNAFLVATYAPQAVLYNDRSVLENHHAASAWNLFLSRPEFNFLCHLDTAEFKRFRFLVIECILATDLKRHFEIVAEFNAKANDDEAPGIDWMSEADRLLAMNMCIKLADINGPCKRHDIHVQWTHRIAEEFYEQGDEESDLGLQVSPYMDRKNPQLAKLQESFITHLVAPLCNAYGEGGLLPGMWDDELETSDENDSSDETETLVPRCSEDVASIGENTSTAAPEGSCPRPLPNRKVRCLQTIHLQENYDYWKAVHKKEVEDEEKAEKEEEEASQEVVEGEDKQAAADAEMETIEEEGALQRLSPTASTKDDC